MRASSIVLRTGGIMDLTEVTLRNVYEYHAEAVLASLAPADP